MSGVSPDGSENSSADAAVCIDVHDMVVFIFKNVENCVDRRGFLLILLVHFVFCTANDSYGVLGAVS